MIEVDIKLLESIVVAYHNKEWDDIPIDELNELIYQGLSEQDAVKCTCGCSGDPGCCGHSPSCPMKDIEG